MTPSLADVKALAARDLPPGHPGREALLAIPDDTTREAVRAAFPLLVRLLKQKSGVP